MLSAELNNIFKTSFQIFDADLNKVILALCQIYWIYNEAMKHLYLQWLSIEGVYYHIETSPLISSANQSTDFCLLGASVGKEVIEEKITKNKNNMWCFAQFGTICAI